MNLEAYFNRIGYEGARHETLAVLQDLHRLHVQEVPFENLSPLLGRSVPLDLPSLERKLIASGRGGYCFEHNILFWNVLRELGFRVSGLAARVRWNAAADAQPARTHMLLRVDVAGVAFIADVGFGGLTLTAPLQLRPDIEQATPHEVFRLLRADERWLLQAKLAEQWQALYDFDLQEQTLADYQLTNWYTSNHPQSQFVTGLMTARAETGRRHALRNNRYSVREPGGSLQSVLLTSLPELKDTLVRKFHIRLPQDPLLDEKLLTLL